MVGIDVACWLQQQAAGAGSLFHHRLGDRPQSSCFHGCGAAEAPQRTGQTEDHFPLDGGLRIVIGDDRGLEGLVVLGILQRADHGLGGQAVADGIAAGALLAFLRGRSGTFAGIAAIGLPLAEGGHGGRG